ncbi:unnamed protein product [Ostreobium quekettii]|uniref:BTB domain-containing protein n=1 Tax=Ostreobium quekettii TaxID=121088 RepID=A0A8S1IR35_9CHLO|nr:unnamed protein product [Ostreobium quekettii]|eukprot:evm.model.scf_1358.2 EVM.evm.TU.scf_1358.2   scf_1358:32545-34663(-)
MAEAEASQAGDHWYMPGTVEYSNLCDVVLVVQGQKLPVHSGVLALHSQFFCRMLSDLTASGECTKEDGRTVITLDKAVGADEARLMLAVAYGRRTKLTTAREAWSMVHLGDKYEMAPLFRATEEKLCELEDSLYFIKREADWSVSGACSEAPPEADGEDDCLNAARWLGVADRLAMHDLKRKCQRVIMRDMIEGMQPSPMRPELDAAMDALNAHNVAPRSVCEIFGAFMRLDRPSALKCDNCQAAQALAQLFCTSCHRKGMAHDGRKDFRCLSCSVRRPLSQLYCYSCQYTGRLRCETSTNNKDDVYTALKELQLER